MLGLKFLAVVLLVGAISPTQIAASGGLVGGLTGDGDGGLVDELLDSVGDVLAGLFGKYHGGRKGIIGIVKALIADILKLNIPGTIDDLGKLIYKLGITLCKLLNGLIPGLGTAIFKILGGIAQIIICDLGSQGLIGELLGGKAGAAVPNAAYICKTGLYPDGNLHGNITYATAKKIIGEGCDDGYEYWDKMKGYNGITGLLKVILNLLENILGLGEKCRDSKYNITLFDFSSIFNYLFTFFSGCAKYYKYDSGLISKIGELLGDLLGGYGFSVKSITKLIANCDKGNGLEDLPKCFSS